MIFCPACASGNADNAKFCSECGKSLIQKTAPSPENVPTDTNPEGIEAGWSADSRTRRGSSPTLSAEPEPAPSAFFAFDLGLAPEPKTAELADLPASVPDPVTTTPGEPTSSGDTGESTPVLKVAEEERAAIANLIGFAPPGGTTGGSSEVTIATSGSGTTFEPTMQVPVSSVTFEPTAQIREAVNTAAPGDAEATVAGPTASGATVPAPGGFIIPSGSAAVTIPPDRVIPPVARPTAPAEQPGRFMDFRETLARLQQSQSPGASARKADILFVLDCTGSMQGEIDAIKDTILSFVDEIERDGIRVRVGLLAFGDRFNGEESFVFKFSGEPFTKDAALFRQEVSRLRAGGGGDIPESSLDALLLALRQPFSPEASKVLVLVTDAPPHIPDVEARTLEQVSDAIRAAGIKQLYLVVRTQDPASNVYLKLLEGTQGLAFELGSGEDFRTRADNFKKTLRALGRTISTGTR